MIDNITPSWLYIPAADRYVPPLTWGVVFQATANSRQDQALWRTPPGIIPATTQDLGRATVTFTDQFIPPSSGVSLISPSQPIHLGTFPASGASHMVTPPPGADTIIIVVESGISTTNFQVFGVQSGAEYVQPLAAATAVLFVPIDMGTDLSYNVYAGGNAFSVDASFVVQALAIQGTVEVGGTVEIAGTVEVAGTVAIAGTVTTETFAPQVLGNISGAGPTTFVLPANTTAVMLTASALASVRVAGSTTNQVYGVGVISPIGAPPYGIADAAGSAIIFPVNIAADPSIVCSQLSALPNVIVTALFTPQSEPVQGVAVIGQAGPNIITPVSSNIVYTLHQLRPTFDIASGLFALAAGAGQIAIAAPGVGFSIVLRKGYFSPSTIPAAATLLELGTASGSATLYRSAILAPLAAEPEGDKPPMVWDDYLVGDNLPVYITASAIVSIELVLTYCIVITALWPTG